MGKNTLLTGALRRLPQLKYSVSATTRPPRAGEKHGVHYWFVSDREFDRMVAAGELLEWAWFSGYRYGTPRSFIMEALERGESVALDIDTQGAAQIRRRMAEAVLVFLAPPGMGALEERLSRRGPMDPETKSRRLRLAREELAAAVDYDYLIVNADQEQAIEQLVAIVRAEACRVSRLDLEPFLSALRKEGTEC